jgi:AcrR family transcriptional regulator
MAARIQEARSSGIFAPTQLPRGPHRLSREEVASSQRGRLLAAITGLVADRGYASTTITDLARAAGVSPNVFYEHFASKEECFLAAYEVFTTTLLTRVSDQVEPTDDWTAFLLGAADAYLSALEGDRPAARAFLLEMDAAGPEARRRRNNAWSAFAALLRDRHEQMRAHEPRLGALPERTYLGICLGVRALVCGALEESPPAPLTELTPDIVHWVIATIRGASAATRELGRRR